MWHGKSPIVYLDGAADEDCSELRAEITKKGGMSGSRACSLFNNPALHVFKSVIKCTI